jgi:hypothetical protein
VSDSFSQASALLFILRSKISCKNRCLFIITGSITARDRAVIQGRKFSPIITTPSRQWSFRWYLFCVQSRANHGPWYSRDTRQKLLCNTYHAITPVIHLWWSFPYPITGQSRPVILSWCGTETFYPYLWCYHASDLLVMFSLHSITGQSRPVIPSWCEAATFYWYLGCHHASDQFVMILCIQSRANHGPWYHRDKHQNLEFCSKFASLC